MANKVDIYPDSPLNAAQWEQMNETIIEAARKQLIGRRFIEIYGPIGEGIQSINVDIFDELQGGGIDVHGSKLELSVPSRRRNLTIPMLYKDFTLYRRDFELAKSLSIPLDLSPAANAATQCARLEDELIFQGSEEFDLPGLMNVKGRLTHIIENWMESGKAFEDVVEATRKLQQVGQTGPYALVLSPELYASLHRVHQGTNVLEIEHVKELVTDGVFQSPSLKGRSGVMVNTGRHNFDLVIAEDFDSAFLDSEHLNFLFRVYETIVLRIKRPIAICTFEEA
ncbi:family 1 encapsulin nanocompartment shell protein [Paenibacillus beijingensis]|uniref:Type 1 encapsulin shell protein n=1 Tax=Paenibacillus beijingensis TaxID=1126833 RepID=A0A0D5NS11_9BACL|nr:family 1 encapsulin nanocompartment shell protein [Paenibacillus beijingensis]AJY77782.1 bacteriocin [Paenibacillus beijingensis]